MSSANLVQQIKCADFSGCSVTVVGYGNMGRQYIAALKVLGVKKIVVCSRSEKPLEELHGISNVEVIAGGYQQLKTKPEENELVIIATPTSDLIPAACYLRELGFKKFLIEKPVSLWSSELEKFAQSLQGNGVEVFCAYNRVAYPAVLEAKFLAFQEGGITSCTYTFTEFTGRLDPKNYAQDEMKRWGVANSLHVMSLAHSLIGMPQQWTAYRTGFAIPWHPAGSEFSGAGISEKGILFSYHADWGSTGRWGVEIHTKVASYRFCPLEKLSRRVSFNSEWEELPVKSFAPEIKVGFVEQVASVLNKKIRENIPLVSLQQVVALTRYGEYVFNYVSAEQS